MTSSDKPSVLFGCVHNAGRSQMAAAWLSHLAGDRVEIRSAGSAPADTLNPAAVEAMAEVGIEITDRHPKILTTDAAGASDVCVTMGCGDTHPAWTPDSNARAIMASARRGLVSIPWARRSSGIPACAHQPGTSVQDRGRYSSRSINARLWGAA